MAQQSSRHSIQRSIRDLLFHRDPETRRKSAAMLGECAQPISVERDALEALTTALSDPCALVKDAALQSLVRLSVR